MIAIGNHVLVLTTYAKISRQLMSFLQVGSCATCLAAMLLQPNTLYFKAIVTTVPLIRLSYLNTAFTVMPLIWFSCRFSLALVAPQNCRPDCAPW